MTTPGDPTTPHDRPAGSAPWRPLVVAVASMVVAVVTVAVLFGGLTWGGLGLGQDPTVGTYAVSVCAGREDDDTTMVDVEWRQGEDPVQEARLQVGALMTAHVPAGAGTQVYVDGRLVGEASHGQEGDSFAFTGQGCPTP